MHTTFKVKVNNTFDFEISFEDILSIDTATNESLEQHILENSRSYNAKLISSDFSKKQYQVSVNNTLYTVAIASPLDELIKNMGFSVGNSKQVNVIKAPMPGLILDIIVEVGQEVKKGDTLLILEAMKMENSITSPRDGNIKLLKKSKGSTIEKGDLLIEFE
ncbi:MAG: biotin/lipoyl-containing protein [Cellulophaga sp.]